MDNGLTSNQLNWYILNVKAGREESIAKKLIKKIKTLQISDSIKDVLVPTQKKIKIVKGEKKITQEKIFPGYILIKTVLNPQVWETIKSMSNIRGFVKTDQYPKPLSKKEVTAIMKFMKVEQPTYTASFKVGDAVKVIDDAFKDFVGNVQTIDEEHGKVKVQVSFLGREVDIDLNFSQVSKM